MSADQDPAPLEQALREVADLRARSTELAERLATDRVVLTAPDGSVTVTLGLTGALEDLRLGHRACELGPARLTAVIMRTVAAARTRATHQAAAAFAPMGVGTEAMRMVNMFLPDEENPDPGGAEDHGEHYAAEERARAPRAPVRLPRRPRPAEPEDDEEVDLW
ncbi:YbaB/EbfC family nucleoid-associated protein [Actinokineospora sp. NBRC 105648]|uniref:YbaB/EbfC family nucleoid-associated protein n=1 Tax=Actinokineospora sp. NBRC 105648 TaxID=3032206 RepID=UPI0024A56273|nr:YbaB/EbfC family nucleoid-associated protein [Actinokineospora sp. NBRC 105648]GLZ38688.1 hypothetical protein Acsp05_23120 [Actinokineospora sp. NBRC 105648]